MEIETVVSSVIKSARSKVCRDYTGLQATEFQNWEAVESKLPIPQGQNGRNPFSKHGSGGCLDPLHSTRAGSANLTVLQQLCVTTREPLTQQRALWITNGHVTSSQLPFRARADSQQEIVVQLHFNPGHEDRWPYQSISTYQVQ